MEIYTKIKNTISTIYDIGNTNIVCFSFSRTFNILSYTGINPFKYYLIQIPLVEKNRNNYIISYNYNNNDYKILLKKKRLRKRIKGIEDENGIDVIDNVKPYMGPFLDFHGLEICPIDLGYNKLTFYMLNGDIQIYNSNDILL